MPRDFQKALKEADDRAAKAGMPAPVDRRLRERLGLSPAPRTVPGWRWIALGAAVAASAAVALFVFAPRQPSQLGGFALLDASGDFGAQVLPDQAVQITRGNGTLLDPVEGVTLASLAPGSVRKEKGGVRVVAGAFETRVAKRARSAVPCRVLVSHGAIEVLGTRFTVLQGRDGGKVTLHEGAIRFVADDGRRVMLAPGESLTWPLPAPSAPPVEPGPDAGASVEPEVPVKLPATHVATAPLKPAEPDLPIEELLGRIDQMRSRGQFDAAADQLVKALKGGYAQATRERLSFELGTIFSRPGSDGARACGHWREHSKRFPNGRYDREIDQAIKRLGCPGP